MKNQNCYNCTSCQRKHYESDIIYTLHLSKQDKDGIFQHEPPKLTGRQYNKINPEKYVMRSGNIFIAPQELSGCKTTVVKSEAEVWTALDATESRLSFFKALCGLKDLKYEQL